MILPNSFESNIKPLLPDYDKFTKSLDSKRVTGLRINTLKTDGAEIQYEWNTLESVSWCENGYYFENIRPAKKVMYHAGLFYIQEPSAMLPASVVPIEEGDYVLDLCAAPGGKTTRLGERLRGTGLLVSNDISATRCKTLVKNIERHGITNACVISENPEKLKPKFSDFFNKILIDAPCSGEGMFRKDDCAIKAWLEKGPGYYAPIQQKLLECAAHMLAEGGMIAYSTCTFNAIENEMVIMGFLENHEDFELIPINHELLGLSKGLLGLDGCARIWPHSQKGEGHFLSLLQKKGGKPQIDNIEKKAVKINGIEYFRDFVSENIAARISGDIILHGSSLMAIPKGMPDTAGLRVARSGFYLGELKQNRFEPSQALAMSLNMDEANNTLALSFDDDRVLRYLKGESLDIPAKDGYYLLCAGGHPLGWGKSSNNRIKNKYAKNWIIDGI